MPAGADPLTAQEPSPDRPVPGRRRGRLLAAFVALSTQTAILAYAAILVAVAAVMVVVLPGNGRSDGAWVPLELAVLAGVVAVCEAIAFHVEFRRQTFSVSVSTIPLVVALLYLPTAGVLVAYLLGAGLSFCFIRRTPWLKTVWNVSMYGTQAGVAAWTLHLGLGAVMPDSALEWSVVVLAIAVAELFSSLAVAVVIWVAERRIDRAALEPIIPQLGISIVGSCFIVIVLRVVDDQPAMTVYGVVPMLGFMLFVKSNERMRRREQDLVRLQTFTVAESSEDEPVMVEGALREFIEIMRSDRSMILLAGSPGSPATMRSVTENESYEFDASELVGPLLDVVAGRDVAIISANDPRIDIRRTATRLGVKRALVAPILIEGDAPSGVVLVGDRLGVRTDYRHEEIQLFVSLARTLGSRIRNTVLSEQVRLTVSRDALTGLANRSSFEQRLDDLARSSSTDQAVMWVDIKAFGEINELLGPETGDEILGAVARRLEAVARPTDFIARVGGDEFAVILDCEGSSCVGRAKWIHGSLNRKIEVEGLSFELRVCAGLVAIGASGLRPEEVIRRASVAVQEAKRTPGGFAEFVEEHDGGQGRRVELYLSVPTAFERGEFTIALQPKVSTIGGRVTGAEALARWSHPTLGPISPGEFMPLVVQTGMVPRLTRAMIERAAEAITRLTAIGVPMSVSVNVTARDLLDPTLPSVVFESLRRFGARPEMLKVEITEDSAIVDFATTVKTLERLREIGVTASLDDFGTGFASLGHLHQLPLQELKVDRSFVQRLPFDPRAAAVVRAAVSLAEAMNMTTVAEGVEDVPMLRQVRALGVTEIQGYLVSRPIPLDEFCEWVVAWQGRPILDWLALCESDVASGTAEH